MVRRISFNLELSPIYLQNLKVRQLPEPELLASFQKLLKMRNYFVDWLSATHLCAYILQSIFCHAGEADIHLCLCRTSSLVLVCTLFIITRTRWMIIQTHLVHHPSFRYRFWAILSQIWFNWEMVMLCFAALLITQAILYIWKKCV